MLQEAAMVAHMFKIDPITVLDERDQFKVAARYAASLYVAEEQKKAADSMKKK